MARPSAAAAAALLLLLSLLAVVAHCRPIEPQSATDDDENGPPNPMLPAEEALPAEEHGFLRLPSHRHRFLRHHRPCRHGPFFHRHHLWWARHHGAFFGDDDAPAPRRFHFRHRRHGHDDEALIHLPAAALPFPADESANREAAGAEEEVKAVAEPDPDRSLPDGEAFADADGAHEAAEVVAHRHEMLRRWLRFHHRHGMRLRHYRDDEHEREEAEDEAEGLKRFHHHHHHHGEDEDKEKHAMRKRFRRGERDDGDDEEDEEVEEMVRRFRKAVMRRRQFGQGRRRFHHHHLGHRHAEKADAQEEEGGVVAWIKGLVNRF